MCVGARVCVGGGESRRLNLLAAKSPTAVQQQDGRQQDWQKEKHFPVEVNVAF